jgi:hypothetical protein
MSTPYESAQIVLRLYELRREPLLRVARHWFTREFHPDSAADVQAALAGEHNPHFRMVIGYWEMAASFVSSGALDRRLFLDNCAEAIATFSKIQPFLADIRKSYTPTLAQHLESVLMEDPGMEERLEATRKRLRGATKLPPPAVMVTPA